LRTGSRFEKRNCVFREKDGLWTVLVWLSIFSGSAVYPNFVFREKDGLWAVLAWLSIFSGLAVYPNFVFREKDGLWAVLAWLSILAHRNGERRSALQRVADAAPGACQTSAPGCMQGFSDAWRVPCWRVE
jgi:phosphoglucomutase